MASLSDNHIQISLSLIASGRLENRMTNKPVPPEMIIMVCIHVWMQEDLLSLIYRLIDVNVNCQL